MDGWNYFNYFTEIEEYFWKKRGAHLLVSPIDWAIMEAWQQAGVPIEAVLKGIDNACESYSRSRRGAGKPLKSLAYCTDAVMEAAAEAKEASAGAQPTEKERKKEESFSREALRDYFERNSKKLQSAETDFAKKSEALAKRLDEIRNSLSQIAELIDPPSALDLEDVERRLTILDDKLHAALVSEAGDEMMLRIRREMDGQLAAYRRKMRPEQLALVEKQFMQKRLLEEFRLPRFSLFYMQ